MKRHIMLREGVVSGWCDQRFLPVLDQFVKNFDELGEIGASVAIVSGDQVLVDLQGGFVDRAKTVPWQADTLCVLHSCTKAATALCLHVLMAEGAVSRHDRVTRFWPEYAQAGQAETTLAMLLDPTSGLPALMADVKAGGFLDWQYMTDLLAAAAPLWAPGTAHGYQMTTFGWLVGEVVRRVSGQSLGEFFKEQIATKLKADFWIGLPASEHARVAPLIRYKPNKKIAPAAFTKRIISEPDSISAKAYFNTGGFKADATVSYEAEFGAGGGITNALGLARMYAPLAAEGQVLGRQFIRREQVALIAETSVKGGEDKTLAMPTHFSMGFMKTMDNRHRPGGALESLRLGSTAFGHAGAGGSLGFADPETGLAFGYVMNQMGPGILLNERGQSLVNAAYISQGFEESILGDYRRGAN